MRSNNVFTEDFTYSSLLFDDHCATEYAFLVAARSAQEQPISTEDAQIAAPALIHRMALATHNVKYFKSIQGLNVLNQWDNN